MEKGFVMPHSKESEMMVLGCMLTSSHSLNVGADGLQKSDFYFSEHQLIFGALQEAYQGEKPADIHLISETLKRQAKLDAVGGIAYLTDIVQYAGTSAYIEEYVEIIKNKSILRLMIESAKNIEKIAYKEPENVHSALDDAQNAFFKISQSTNQSVGVHIKEVLSGLKAESKLPYLKVLEERQEEFLKRGPNQPAVTGIPTGLIDLDKMIGGLNPSNLIIVAGRPSMGKTALGMNIAENVAFKYDVPVAVFSLEMTADELLHRMICSNANVESEKIKIGSIDGNEYQRIVESVNEMKKHTLIIDDQPGLKISELRARARRLKEVYNIGLIVVDYLQLLSGSKGHFSVDNRQNEISEISRMLKTLAKELNVPIICPSQLSRKVEERTGHRPMLSDLRESGSIEQDADIVMFIYRRDYYNANDHPGMAELIIAKNRHGKIGDVRTTFVKKFARFENYVDESTLAGSYESNEAFAAFSPN